MDKQRQLEADLATVGRIAHDLRTIGTRAQANERERGAEQLEAARALERVSILAAADETDNGYANHETFLAAMQLAGNMTPGGAGFAQRVREHVGEAQAQARVWPDKYGPERVRVADRLQAMLEQLASGRQGGPWAQELATAALGRVDWLELADEQLGQLAELEQDAGSSYTRNASASVGGEEA
jgi:hypothetical protein